MKARFFATNCLFRHSSMVIREEHFLPKEFIENKRGKERTETV